MKSLRAFHLFRVGRCWSMTHNADRSISPADVDRGIGSGRASEARSDNRYSPGAGFLEVTALRLARRTQRRCLQTWIWGR